jgi:S-adenosylmethionine-diacylgycerolhomoserine-N-methlytransferase
MPVSTSPTSGVEHLISTDVRVLWQLLRGQPGHGSHAERLQAFYAPQASRYDVFRERLLNGRRELIDRLVVPHGGRMVELGGGTGRNLLFFGDRLSALDEVCVVDLCPALLDEARGKSAGMSNVRLVEADAVTWRPHGPVDLVYFSYSLTMIPDWQGAIDNALSMLKPGGQLGVVDFYVSRPDQGPGGVHHGAATRWFWPKWFGHDGVRLNPAHLAHLRQVMPDHQLYEHRGRVPYLFGLTVPYYIFIGRKPA